MSIEKVARKLAIKYAAELFDPHASGTELVDKIKNNLALLYKSFMSSVQDGNGDIHQLLMMAKGHALKAPADAADKLNIEKYIRKIATFYTDFVGTIDDKSIVEINSELIKLVKIIEKTRSQVADEIKLNRYMMHHERKKLASTAEKVLKGFEDSLLRQLEYIDAGKVDIDFPTVERKPFGQFELPGGQNTTKRRPMEQTTKKLERLVLTYGSLYGINGMPDYGKIVHSDALLARELISAFMGLDLLSEKDKATNLPSHVKADLKKRVQEVLNPTLPDLPFGPLPKRPPGK